MTQDDDTEKAPKEAPKQPKREQTRAEPTETGSSGSSLYLSCRSSLSGSSGDISIGEFMAASPSGAKPSQHSLGLKDFSQLAHRLHMNSAFSDLGESYWSLKIADNWLEGMIRSEGGGGQLESIQSRTTVHSQSSSKASHSLTAAFHKVVHDPEIISHVNQRNDSHSGLPVCRSVVFPLVTDPVGLTSQNTFAHMVEEWEREEHCEDVAEFDGTETQVRERQPTRVCQTPALPPTPEHTTLLKPAPKLTRLEWRYLLCLFLIKALHTGTTAVDYIAYSREITSIDPEKQGTVGMQMTLRFTSSFIMALFIYLFSCSCYKDRVMFMRSVQSFVVVIFLTALSLFWVTMDDLGDQMTFYGVIMFFKGPMYAEGFVLPALIMYVVFPEKINFIRSVDLAALTCGDLFIGVLISLLYDKLHLVNSIYLVLGMLVAGFAVVAAIMPREQPGAHSTIQATKQSLPSKLKDIGRLLRIPRVVLLSLHLVSANMQYIAVLTVLNVFYLQEYGTRDGSYYYTLLIVLLNVLGLGLSSAIGKWGAFSARTMIIICTVTRALPTLFVPLIAPDFVFGQDSVPGALAVSMTAVTLTHLCTVPVRVYALTVGSICLFKRGLFYLATNMAFWFNICEMFARLVVPWVSLTIYTETADSGGGLFWVFVAMCGLSDLGVLLDVGYETLARLRKQPKEEGKEDVSSKAS